MGDGLGFASLVIQLLVLLVPAGGVVLLGWAGWRLSRGRRTGEGEPAPAEALAGEGPDPGRGGTRRMIGLVAGGALGLALGWLAVTWLFRPYAWNPPPRVQLLAEPGRTIPALVVLVEDARRGQALDWSGSDLPIVTRRATVRVPPSGIARVQALGALGEGNGGTVIWPDGQEASVGGAGSGGAGIGAYVHARRGAAPLFEQDVTMGDPDAFARYVRRQERAR